MFRTKMGLERICQTKMSNKEAAHQAIAKLKRMPCLTIQNNKTKATTVPAASSSGSNNNITQPVALAAASVYAAGSNATEQYVMLPLDVDIIEEDASENAYENPTTSPPTPTPMVRRRRWPDQHQRSECRVRPTPTVQPTPTAGKSTSVRATPTEISELSDQLRKTQSELQKVTEASKEMQAQLMDPSSTSLSSAKTNVPFLFDLTRHNDSHV
ncbi:uncharacterized protein LOC125769459 [Anopheles funestus]|uniref:uncharacterized protein LOC125769459 n=1 Tax=Anopheles funestus TaxID=62324 RepID=UPI0020C71B91|nr:uncharacterized protein LOC125769459 [Anopheles funestus]